MSLRTPKRMMSEPKWPQERTRQSARPVAWHYRSGRGVDNFAAGATKPPGDGWVPLYSALSIIDEREFWQAREREIKEDAARDRRVLRWAIVALAVAAVVVAVLLIGPA